LDVRRFMKWRRASAAVAKHERGADALSNVLGFFRAPARMKREHRQSEFEARVEAHECAERRARGERYWLSARATRSCRTTRFELVHGELHRASELGEGERLIAEHEREPMGTFSRSRSGREQGVWLEQRGRRGGSAGE
jgi:hypothetical protein